MRNPNPWDSGWRSALAWSLVIFVGVMFLAALISFQSCIYGGQLCPI